MFEAIEQMIAATRRELEVFPGTAQEFLGLSIEQYRRAAASAPHGAGAANMAVSMFMLARQQQVIDRLVDDLRMRDDALEMLFEMDNL